VRINLHAAHWIDGGLAGISALGRGMGSDRVRVMRMMMPGL
jgi:hypothetical protein